MRAGQQRARAPADKAERRAAFLAAGRQRLDTHGYAAVSVERVVGDVGLAKGSFYRYFSSKEALFVALLQEELAAWAAAVGGGLAALPDGARSEAARLVARESAARPRLIVLLSLLHATLEAGLTEAELRAFKGWLGEVLAPLAEALERVCGWPSGEGVARVLWLHAFVVGLAQVAPPDGQPLPPVVAAVRADPALAAFRLSFPEALEAALCAWWAGL